MDSDDLEPRRPAPGPANLDAMSVEALRDYVRGLEAEIARARAMIESKQAARTSADSVFRT